MNRGNARRFGYFAALAGGTIAAGLATSSGTIAGTPGLEGSFNPSVSADGRYIAFSSFRDELGGPINTDVLNVYVYDRKRGKVQLVSRRSGPGGAGGDDDSGNPSISDDGRYVAFHTQADNLGGPAADVNNVYVYDRERKKVSLVSRRGGATGMGGDGSSVFPDISGNGRFVAFATFADNLGGPAANVENVYVFDRKRKQLRLVSRRSGRRGAGADDSSYEASLSANGRYVGFTSEADNLGGPTTDTGNVYVYDRKRKRVQLVSRQSRAAGGAGGDGFSEDPSLSASGRFVAFETQADNLGGPAADVEDNVYVYDRKRKRVRLISRQSGANGAGGDDESEAPKIAASGRFVAFETEADNLGGPAADVDNIYVYDRKRKRVRLVSRESGAGGEGGNATSASPSISASGRFIAFFTNADNLGGPAAVGSSNIYMFDRTRSRVLLVSQPSS